MVKIGNQQNAYVVKEGTTIADLKKHGSKEQIALFNFFDMDLSGTLSKEEASAFNNASFKFDGKQVKITEKYGWTQDIDYVKLNKNVNLLRKYGIKCGFNEIANRIENIHETVIKGKKVLVIDSYGYSLTIPVENTKNISLELYDGMPAFKNLKNATILCDYYAKPLFFQDSQVKVYCRDGIQDFIHDEGNCKLTIITNDTNDQLIVHERKSESNYDGETLKRGTSQHDTTSWYKKAKKKVLDWLFDDGYTK